MKQVLNQKGRIIIEDVPIPVPTAGQILVKTSYSCISTGTELSGLRSSATPVWRKALQKPQHVKKTIEIARDQGIKAALEAVESKLGTPKPLGYSLSGTVVALGDGVSQFRLGDKVACAGAQCAHHAEYASVPANLAVVIPDRVEMDAASIVALGAISLQGVRRLEPTLGETFLVVGLGLLGQLTVQILKAAGCKVIGIDLDERRASLATKLGMDHCLTASDDMGQRCRLLTDGMGVDGAIVTASGGDPKILRNAFQACRKKGRVVLVGDVPIQLERDDLYEKELDFRISTSYGPGRYDSSFEEKGVDYPFPYVRWTETRNMDAFLDLLSQEKLHLKDLIEGVFPIASAESAFQMLNEKKPLVCLLKYDENASNQSHEIKLNHSHEKKAGNIRLAIVGAGAFIENVQLPNIQRLQRESKDLELDLIICRTGHKSKTLANRYRAKKCGTDWNLALRDPDIDAVIIGTRHDQHSKMAGAFLAAGKHVLVEKPLALNEIELHQLELFYKEKKQTPILLTGFNRRFSPAIREIKSRLNNRTGPLIIQYQMNAGFIPADHWVHGPEGGGRNIGEACHIYDLFLFLVGNLDIQKTQVSSLLTQNAPYRADDNFQATFQFSDGSIATLLYTALGNTGYPKEKMTVYCDGKIVDFVDYQSWTFVESPEKRKEFQCSSKGHLEELSAFFDAIKRGIVPISLEEQLKATRMSFEVQNLLFQK